MLFMLDGPFMTPDGASEPKALLRFEQYNCYYS